MMLRNHPKIADWPPLPGGNNVTAESSYDESQPVLVKVHEESVTDTSVPLTCSFKGNTFTYDVMTKEDSAFAKKLAAELSKHIGNTVKQLGDLDVNF